MDKIEQAIARARQQRQGKIGQTEGYENIHEQVEVKNFDNKKSSAPDTRLLQLTESLALSPSISVGRGHEEYIDYSQTKVVSLDETTLCENRVIASINEDERAEIYRLLRTQVQQLLDENSWNTLAITSAGENAGKTLTATNLAISLSRELNHTVMLVDLDLRRPSVHETLGIEVEKGLVDYLKGEVELDEVLVNPGLQRLVVLPGRALGYYSSELLSSPKMTELLANIKNRYSTRIIIFDLPPLLRNDDALLFAPSVDASLLVVEEGVTTADELQRCIQLLDGCNLIGTVLNKAQNPD